MPTYTQNRITIAFPEADLELAQRLGELFDPDSGGRETFVSDRVANGHLWTSTVVYEELEPMLRRRDPAEWYPFLLMLATEKGLEPLTQEEVEHLCAACLLDEEFSGLSD